VTNELPELLPCPFCGGEAVVEGTNWYGKLDLPPYYAACGRCEAKLGYDWAPEEGGHSPAHAFNSRDKAAAAWNARAAVEQAKPAAQPAQVTEAVIAKAVKFAAYARLTDWLSFGGTIAEQDTLESLAAAQQPGGE
jgi:Lar family restriction alleviation protein